VNILQGYLIFRLMLAILGMGILLVGAYFLIGHEVMVIWKVEKVYQQQYGETWREHYLAERHISVEDDHRKAIFGVAGLATMTVLCYLIYRQIVPRRSGRKRSRRRHRSSFTTPS
jgi:hypothetical protein